MQRCLSPEEISKGKQVTVLILAPTRELVLQISAEAKKLLRKLPFSVLPFIGGTSKKEDLNRIISKRVDVVIATPGRVVDLISSSTIFRSQLEELKVLVLDEADELMKHGFAQNVLTVLKNLPRTRQTMLFSATMPSELEQTIARKAFRNLDNVHVINTCTVSPKTRVSLQQHKIEQKIAYVSHNLHLHLLFGIIRQSPSSKTMLFLPTVLSVQIFAALFKELGFPVLEMHSLLGQEERVTVTSKFREASAGLLITTDVSARGMDYPDVDLVIQWGVPSSIDNYLHRIGRTGRAGRPGKAIMIVTPLEERFLHLLEDASVPFTILDVEAEIQKPPSEEIHQLNQLCSRIKPGLIRQLFRSTLTYRNQRWHFLTNNLDLTLCALLDTSRRQAYSQTKNYIVGLGHRPPTLDWKHLSADIKKALSEVNKAKDLISKL
ncbi:hypothetical protein DSO57_1027641 [Entomophthora muscae]|uniref:Uncharacterized protein n=1 Tax=Entomophthora muscae TaxID=34485 RepID=A0ACC2SQL5_9FUNG|nr:hypothetical protein DSO57_1027641 [Entomophthora muscae]